MIPVATAHTRCFFSCFSFGDLSTSSPPVVVVKNPRAKAIAGGGSVSSNLCSVGFSRLGRGQGWNSSWWRCGFARRSTGDSDVVGDSELEAEVSEFMRTSVNPGAFPTEKQLINAGREDLAVAISKQGGWLAMGWKVKEDDGRQRNADFGDWEYRTGKDRGNGVRRTIDSVEESDDLDFHEVGGSGVSSSSSDSSNSAPNSGRSLETTNEDDSGVDGILKRLEKERNISFGVGLKRKGNSPKLQSNSCQNERVTYLKKSNKGNDDSVHRSVLNFDGLPAWKAWSYQRAASSIEKSEAGEVALQETSMGRIRDGSRESLGGREEINFHEIQSSIRCLDLELSCVLVSLKSKANAILIEEYLHQGDQSKPEVLRTLSDAWEFHENKIMKAQDRLRSIRAKLAVLDGKVALAIIDAKKIVDGKQKRIDDARKALQFLRTVYIVWTNSGSEVLLLGSYDGWTSKRKMKKTSSGIFTLYLKLYPGTYEIKFLVDGEWKIDPLRPIVHYSEHENNQLIIE